MTETTIADFTKVDESALRANLWRPLFRDIPEQRTLQQSIDFMANAEKPLLERLAQAYHFLHLDSADQLEHFDVGAAYQGALETAKMFHDSELRTQCAKAAHDLIVQNPNQAAQLFGNEQRRIIAHLTPLLANGGWSETTDVLTHQPVLDFPYAHLNHERLTAFCDGLESALEGGGFTIDPVLRGTLGIPAIRISHASGAMPVTGAQIMDCIKSGTSVTSLLNAASHAAAPLAEAIKESLTLGRAHTSMSKLKQLMPSTLTEGLSECELRTLIISQELEHLGFTPAVLKTGRIPPFEHLGKTLDWGAHWVTSFTAETTAGNHASYVIDPHFFPDAPVLQTEWEAKMHSLGVEHIAPDTEFFNRCKQAFTGTDTYFRERLPAIFEAYYASPQPSVSAAAVISHAPTPSYSGDYSPSYSGGSSAPTRDTASKAVKEAEGGKLGMIALGVGAAVIAGYAIKERLRRQENTSPETSASK